MLRAIAGLLVVCLIPIVVFGQADDGVSTQAYEYFVGTWRCQLDETFYFVFTITDTGDISWQRTDPDPQLSPMDYAGTAIIYFYSSKSGGYPRGLARWDFAGEASVDGTGLFERIPPDADGVDQTQLTLYMNTDIYLVGSAGMWTTLTLARDQLDEIPNSD